MPTFQIVAILIVFALAFRAGAATPTTNPADLEREVIEQINAHHDPIEQADDPDKVPVDAALAQYVADRRPLLAMMHRAAAMPHADWGPFDGDVMKVMPSLNGARGAAILTWLAARDDAAHGRFAEAVDELFDGIALVRHVGQRPLLVTQLVEIGAEAGSIGRLAALLPGLPPDLAATFPTRLDALPPSAGLAAVIDGERQFGRARLGQQLAATLPADAPPEAVKQRDAIAAMANGIDTFYDAVRAAAPLPPAAFAKAVDAAVAKSPDNLFVKILAPSLNRIREPGAIVEAKRAMLRAAAVIVVEGPAAVDAFHDPFGPGPFAYTPTAHGFVLTSALVARRTPVTLTVGRDSDPATRP